MDNPQKIRLLIRRRLLSGLLPKDRLSRASWGRSNGEFCDACEGVLTHVQILLKGTTSVVTDRQPTQFHVRCFQIWNDERRTLQSSVQKSREHRP